MAAVVMVLRKMVKNRWLVLCLLLGLIISVALVSSIPMYSSGVLQKLLTKDLEEYQVSSNNYPGSYQFSLYYKEETKAEDKPDIYNELDRYIKQNVPGIIDKPYLMYTQNVSLDPYKMTPEDPNKVDPRPNRYGKIQALMDFEEHIKLIDGRMPAKDKVDGVYEALVTEGALNKLDMVLGNVFIIDDPGDEQFKPIRIKPVGVFEPKDERDLYWFRAPSVYNESFIIDYDLFKRDFVNQTHALIKSSNWYYAFDYNTILVQDINKLLANHVSIIKDLNNIYNGFTVNVPMIGILQKYTEQQKQVSMLLLALNVPVLLMLIFYIFMVSFLIIDSDKNEIAILRSRGAGRFHIMVQYLIEGIILAGVAFVLGPPLGLLLTKFLGTSNGFMEFVNRKALPVALSASAYKYALIAAAASVIMLLIPAYFASNISIVVHKQQLARYTGSSWWQRSFIDVILMLIAGYGLYTFNQHQQVLAITNANATELQVNPLLFFASTLFALGIGLFFLRIYPWIVEAIYRLGNRWWTPSLYETLTQVSRSSRQYQFLMVFLIMTIATGLFSANSARTINKNIEDRIYYQIGADVAMMPAWESNAPPAGATVPSSTPQPTSAQGAENGIEAPERIQYSEPPFLSYQQLPGVEHATRVFQRGMVDVTAGGQRVSDVQLMAIEPYDFGLTAWFRDDLLKPYHINNYLNLLSQEPSAALISRSMSKAYGINKGDYIYLSWNGVDAASFIVYEVIDYWPSWNPNRNPNESLNAEYLPNDPMLVVANLPYVQNHLALEPYEIWLKMKPGATSAELYKGIEDKKLEVSDLRDASQEIIKIKNDPMQLGLNGAMTLGFIISLAITFLGFLLYWILSMRGRTFEFGVLRAIGMSLPQLLSMMVWEQVLTSGMAIVAGILVGGLTSTLFVPLLQVAYSAVSQVPPFKVISYFSDRAKLYIMVGIMLGSGLAILGNILSRIKISQAIKMGEE
jgi:putative ABC transport system permease protein